MNCACAITDVGAHHEKSEYSAWNCEGFKRFNNYCTIIRKINEKFWKKTADQMVVKYVTNSEFERTKPANIHCHICKQQWNIARSLTDT
jgi:hypothetical protein